MCTRLQIPLRFKIIISIHGLFYIVCLSFSLCAYVWSNTAASGPVREPKCQAETRKPNYPKTARRVKCQLFLSGSLHASLCYSPLPQPALLQRRLPPGPELTHVRERRRESGHRAPPSHPDEAIRSRSQQQPDDCTRIKPQVDL